MKTEKMHLIALAAIVLSLSVLFGACGTVPTPEPVINPTVPPTPTVPAVPTATIPPPSPLPTEPEPKPTDPVDPKPTSGPACTDRAAFEGDITIPDGTILAPDKTFVKTWRLRNSGTCAWTKDYMLVFVGGSDLSGPAAVPLPHAVAPGETVDLSVTLTSPAVAGTYAGRWQLRSAGGVLFGLGDDANPFWVCIVVETPPVVPPTPTPTPTPPPTPVVGWYGEYYGNRDLSGPPTLVRDDAEIRFDWGTSAPAAGLPADGFSVRWTRRIEFEEALYRFHIVVDDGAILYVDNNLVLDAWKDGGLRELTADYALPAGEHKVRVEFYDKTGHAQVRFWWEKVSPLYPDWKAEYWTNPNLSGQPVLVQNEGRLDFAWGLGSAAAGLPVDNWSARWTRKIDLAAATYRFHIRMDDAARLYVDDALVINAWQDGQLREVTTDLTLKQGSHRLRVEFYEKTGTAEMHLWWEVVPPPSYPDWKGSYWTNPDLSGNPKVVRNDTAIDFAWGTGAAAPGLPADKFSARWDRWANFPPGTYTFYAQADNGIRFYLDGDLVLDKWYSNGQDVYSYRVTLGGPHHLVVEYYDNGGVATVKFWWQ